MNIFLEGIELCISAVHIAKNPLELVDEAPLKDIDCPSCGSSFSLIGDESSATLIGDSQSIGHFNLVEHVGAGRFGSVWKAQDIELDRTVAVKIPRKDQLSTNESDVFFREARAAAQLKHPNIVPVHEVGRENNTIFIVSDFIQGANLKEWLSAHSLGFKEAADLCSKLALAIHHAHEIGVVHRDLKPSNIMMDFDGEPHIMDFGLAKRESGEITMTMDGQILGTPAYMSPEQAGGESHRLDGRADVYSLGVVLYELLTGELPFRGEKRMLIVQILNEDPPGPHKLNAKIPRDLETICLKCLEKDPQKRYQTAQNLADDLNLFLENKPIIARPISKLGKMLRWTKRKPAVASLSALVFLMLLTGTTVSTYFAISTNHALDDVKDQKLKVEEQRDRADVALKETRTTIDKYVKTVQNAELLKDRRFKPLMKELLKDALAHYKRFIDENEQDSDSLSDLADSVFQVAIISEISGDIQQATEGIHKVISLRERLLDEKPTNLNYQNALATSYERNGILLKKKGNLTEALRFYRKALDVRKQLSNDYPKIIEYRRNLTMSHGNIGNIYQNIGKMPLALQSYQKTKEILEQLMSENPSVKEYRYQLATTYNNIGALFAKIGELDKAQSAHENALQLRQQLLLDSPSSSSYKNDVAASYHNISAILATNGNHTEALDHALEASGIWSNLAKDHPTVTQYQSYLATIQSGIATLYLRSNEKKKALEYFAKILEIQKRLVRENPEIVGYQINLSGTHNNAGVLYNREGNTRKAIESFTNALTLREKLVKEHPDNDKYKSYLAESYNNVGGMKEAIGQINEAHESYQNASIIFEQLVKKYPKISQYSFTLGGSYTNIATTALKKKEYKKAEEYFKKSIDVLTPFAKKTPAYPTARIYLGIAYGNKAHLMESLNRFDEAVADWEKAIEYDSGSMKANFQKARDAAAGKAKLQKQKKKRQARTDKPLIAPRPKLVTPRTGT